MATFEEILQRSKENGTYHIEGDKIDFAIIVDGLMKKQGISKVVLAEMLGRPVAYVTKLLRADANPSLETMTRVVTALGAESVFNEAIMQLMSKVLKCEDCGIPYKNFDLDVVIPNDQWEAITRRKDGSGILCAACIVKRGSRLPGVTVAIMRFE